MLRKVLALLAFALASPAFAVTVSWAPPTTNVDGSPIVGPLSFKVYGAPQGQTKTVLGTIAPGSVSFVHSPPGGAVFCYAVTAVSGAGESAQSVEACKSIALPPPTAPTSVTIAVVLGLNMAPVLSVTASGARGSTMLGFVPVGLECQGARAFTYRGKTWRRVSTLPVKWWASSPTVNAAVPCSG